MINKALLQATKVLHLAKSQVLIDHFQPVFLTHSSLCVLTTRIFHENTQLWRQKDDQPSYPLFKPALTFISSLP